MQALDQAFQDAATVGVTVLAAAGDSGSSDGVNDGLAHVDFPASSQYVLGCGGTQLTSSTVGTISSEVVWNDQPTGGATGGGISDVYSLPSWQDKADVPPSANPGGQAGRGVPDVAGDADPSTGYTIRVDGQTITVGGTSAVAPLWGGLLARFNQKLGKPMGFLNPQIYGLLPSPDASDFRDIVSGNNGAYKAGPGWDACSGWGSPHGAQLLPALSGSG
jgi:kumamolisin